MDFNYRLLFTVLSIIVTIISFSRDMTSFYRYVNRGRYYYQKVSDDTYMVIKQGHSTSSCSVNGTIFKYGEINWLVVRNKRHYLFLLCFWGSIILPLITSLIGAFLEYKFKSDSNCLNKIFRILRATTYKSSISLPVIILFAFDYKQPCLKLKKTTYMIFSNTFTFTVVAIEFPLLIIIFINEIYELYKLYRMRANPTYDLVKTSVDGQPTPRNVLHIVLYAILYLTILFLLYLCLTIYVKLFLVITLPQYLLMGANILLSIGTIALAVYWIYFQSIAKRKFELRNLDLHFLMLRENKSKFAVFI